MRQITPNVFCEDSASVPPLCRGCTWSYVKTSAGIVLIDTPMVPRTALKWREEMAGQGGVVYIINTHHHVDHTTGNYFFPAGTVVSHDGVREVMTGPASGISGSERLEEVIKQGGGALGYIRLLVGEHDPESLPYLEEYVHRAPEITFSSSMNLYLGEHTFRLMHMPGHTANHIGVYVPEEKVFFTGDNFTSGTQPSLVNSQPLQWIENLKLVEATDAVAVVPGHGMVADRKAVREFRRFIEECVQTVRDAIARGLSREEAAATISFEQNHPGGLLPVHPGPERQRRNVSRLYDMLSVG